MNYFCKNKPNKINYLIIYKIKQTILDNNKQNKINNLLITNEIKKLFFRYIWFTK